MAQTYRVFVSAASGELGSFRREVARVLRCKELEVRDQEHFRQGGGTLLEKLRDYIENCDAVILLVGDRCGAFPTAEHAAALGAIPAFEDYRAHSGQTHASYTQWEFFFAKHFGKQIYLFFSDPAGGFTPDAANSEDAGLQACQQAYRGWLEQGGKDYDLLSDAAKLNERILLLPFPDLRSSKRIILPYPSLGALFKGREEKLAELHTALHQTDNGQATAIVGKALHGLGGVGKTRLAVEYAWEYAGEYSALLLVIADTPQSLRGNLSTLVAAEFLDLPEKEVTEDEVRYAAVLRWFQQHPGWLLILDNVDSPAAAEAVEKLLAQLHGGQVLITSRLSQWSGAIGTMELDVLAGDDAASFLLERTEPKRRKLPSDAADVQELATELGGLALALEQAGAYVLNRRCSLAGYLENWREKLPKVREWHNERQMNYPCSIAVTWQTSIDLLGPGEVALLNILAWFAPEPIPLFVFEDEEAEQAWRKATEEIADGIDITASLFDALAELANYSLLRWDSDSDNVSVHRVVQEILRSRMASEAQKFWLQAGLDLLAAAAPGAPSDVRTWPQWEPLLPHLMLAAEQGDNSGVADPTSYLMNELGLLFKTKARFAEAEPLMRRALQIDEASYGSDHPKVATDLNNLAHLLQATNRLTEAEPLMRRALQIDEASYGPDHTKVAIRLNNLAHLLKDTNRLTEAEPLMRRTLQIDEASYGLDHPDVAIDLNNLAALLQDTNRLTEAEPLFRRALQINETSYGPDHPEVAIRLNNLARLLQATNRLEEAEPPMRRMVDIFIQFTHKTGHEHPHLHAALGNYQHLLEELGRSKAEIEQAFQTLLEGGK